MKVLILSCGVEKAAIMIVAFFDGGSHPRWPVWH
jgi:hypothetical protein